MDERRCVVGPRCKWAEREGPRLVGALLERPEGLCDGCAGRVEESIRGLADDVDELNQLIGSCGGGRPGQRVAHSRDLPVPVRLGVDALRAEIDFEVSYWAEVIADTVGVTWDADLMRRSRYYMRVNRAAILIADRMDTLLALGPQERCAWTAAGEPLRDRFGDRETVECTGLQGALRLDDLHRRVRCAAGRSKLVHRLTPACPDPDCGQTALVRHNGSDHVQCENCGRSWDEKYYRWFISVVIAEQKRAEAAA